jgi:hypothetical protein
MIPCSEKSLIHGITIRIFGIFVPTATVIRAEGPVKNRFCTVIQEGSVVRVEFSARAALTSFLKRATWEMVWNKFRSLNFDATGLPGQAGGIESGSYFSPNP